MRILLVHNHYQSASPSGEDIAFDNERQLLQRAGHEVICYTRHNDAISESVGDRVNVALSMFWSRTVYRELTALIKQHDPEVAHFHNTFPQISASGYRACQDHHVPVVQTLHNYRLICPGALLMRNGKPCEDCIGNSMLPAIMHGCYRNSRVGTALVTAMVNANRMRGTYTHDIDRYICLTASGRQRFIRGGLPADRLIVKPNVLLDPPNVGLGEGGYALYVGRLSPEKGVQTLIKAWSGIDYPLKIVGDGALRTILEQQSRESSAKVEFMGFKPRVEVMALMQRATILIIPSECYEGFPVTALEAFSTGTPLAVSAIGALDEIVNDPVNGKKFQAGNHDSLRQCVQNLLADQNALQAMRLANRVLFDSCYSPTQALISLEEIYRGVSKQSATRELTSASCVQY